MARYVDSWTISDRAEEILKSLDTVEHLLSNFEADVNSNDYMDESLDADCYDIRKTFNMLIQDAKDLAADAKQAARDEVCEEEDEDEDL